MSLTPVITAIEVRGGTLIVRSYQDVEDIIERNKQLRSMPQKHDCARQIADIPNNIVVAWLNEEWARGNTTLKLFGPEWNAFVKKKLADPDWAYLRTG
jgi:hypothetical protein